MQTPNLPPILTQLNSAFLNLEPSAEQCKQLNAQATVIRQALQARMKKALPRTIMGGSFGRSTVLAPVKDLDIFLTLEPQHFFQGGVWPDASAVLERLKQEAEQALRRPDLTAGELKGVPPEALSRLARATLRLQDHSVGVLLPGEAVWFDLVPLLPHKSEAGKWVIPDRVRQTFIYTDPEKQHRVMKQAAQTMGGALNRYIRLIKAWNREHGQLYKSFYLEVMCYDAFKSTPPNMLTGFETLVTHLSARVLEKQPDPTGAGPHIDDGADAQTRQQRQGQLKILQSELAQVQALVSSKQPQDLARAHSLMRGALGRSWGV